MTTDSLIQKVVTFTTPSSCLGCMNEGALLCENCYPRMLPPVAPGTPQTVTSYDDIGKDLIYRFKFEGDQEAGRLCARYMAEVVAAEDFDVVVAVTTTPARRRQRGYDQSELLAREVAGRLALPYVRGLVRVKNVHQIGAGRQQRLAQSAGLYAATRVDRLRGRRVLLIDDVVTTGATMAAAAEALLAAGAQSVHPLAFARD